MNFIRFFSVFMEETIENESSEHDFVFYIL
jgi:hypothetical protein